MTTPPCGAAATTPALDAQSVRKFERDVIPLTHQLFGTALRLTRNAHDAEDLVQEVMLRAYAGYGTFRDGTNLKAWMYRILHNTWVSQYRKKQHRPAEVSVEFISDPQLAAVILRASNGSRSAEDVALESMVDVDLSTALGALREEVRTTVYYADVLQFSYREIAAITGCPIGTVMSRLHRGRKRLRTNMIAAATHRGSSPEQRHGKPLSAA